MYSGVVFDFDGVLYDSEKRWEEIENRYLTDRIPNWSHADHKNLIGSSLKESYKYLKTKGLLLGEGTYFSDYHQMAMALYSENAKPLINVDIILRELASKKVKIAIASSSRREWIDAAITNNKLAVDIPVIACIDDSPTLKGKPAPDLYLRAAELLNEHSSKLIAIEDSKAGVASAKSAGLYCFGLRNGFNETQDLRQADEIINGFTRQNVERIMGLIK